MTASPFPMAPERLPCELISWNRFAQLARRLAFKIRTAGFQPDLIIAIARGGYAPARVLADYLGVMNVTSIKVEHYTGPHQAVGTVIRQGLPEGVRGQRVLIVDDVSDTGDTWEVAIPHVREHLPQAEVRTAVLLHKAVCPMQPDFCARQVLKWRWIIFPWAVIEDLSGLLHEAGGTIGDAETFAKLLRERHRLRVSRQILQDVLDLAATQTWR